MEGKPAIVPQLRRRSAPNQALPSIFMGENGCILSSLWHRPCVDEDDVSQHSNLTPGRISMTRTVASLTAAAVLYAFTSALA